MSTLTLAAQGSVIVAQNLIEKAISSGQAGFGVYQDHPQPSLALFGDLRALACILLRRVPDTGRLAGFVPPEILALHQQPLPEKRRSFDPVVETRPGRLAPRRAATAALATSAALHVLQQSDVHAAGAALRDLISDTDGSIPLKVGLRWAHTSPVFDAIHLATLAPRLGGPDRLRYRTADRLPRRPGRSAATRVAERARRTPTQLWPAWSARLSPLDGALSRTIRPALSCYLLLVGGTGHFTTTARLLRAPVEDRLGSHMTFRLTKRGHFHGIGLGLLALADYLDQEGSPIDYTRAARSTTATCCRWTPGRSSAGTSTSKPAEYGATSSPERCCSNGSADSPQPSPRPPTHPAPRNCGPCCGPSKQISPRR
ncbi:hypothetical protein [Streptomyces asiaticus]